LGLPPSRSNRKDAKKRRKAFTEARRLRLVRTTTRRPIYKTARNRRKPASKTSETATGP